MSAPAALSPHADFRLATLQQFGVHAADPRHAPDCGAAPAEALAAHHRPARGSLRRGRAGQPAGSAAPVPRRTTEGRQTPRHASLRRGWRAAAARSRPLRPTARPRMFPRGIARGAQRRPDWRRCTPGCNTRGALRPCARQARGCAIGDLPGRPLRPCSAATRRSAAGSRPSMATRGPPADTSCPADAPRRWSGRRRWGNGHRRAASLLRPKCRRARRPAGRDLVRPPRFGRTPAHDCPVPSRGPDRSPPPRGHDPHGPAPEGAQRRGARRVTR